MATSGYVWVVSVDGDVRYAAGALYLIRAWLKRILGQGVELPTLQVVRVREVDGQEKNVTNAVLEDIA